MFSFFRQKQTSSTSLVQDVHAHWLPAIDDGPKDMETTIEMIQLFQQMGYQQLIATPHVFEDYYPNTKEAILERFAEVQTVVKQKNIDIALGVAAEYHLDHNFKQLLQAKELLPLFDNHILVECDLLDPTPNLKEYIFDIKIEGYQPILAHPERYLYMESKDYKSLQKRGCTFQINLLSLLGHYGSQVQKRAKSLLKITKSVYLGTDAHHVQHLKKIQHYLKSKRFQQATRPTNILNQIIPFNHPSTTVQ